MKIRKTIKTILVQWIGSQIFNISIVVGYIQTYNIELLWVPKY